MSYLEKHNRTLIKNYVVSLFKYLSNQAYCFTSGAFVIQDNNARLLRLLMNNLTVERPAVKSHTKFLNESSDLVYETRFDCANGASVVVNCRINGKTAVNEFKMIKWYPFTENGNSYIYMKPETSCGSNNPTHAFDASYKKMTNLFSKNKDNKNQSQRSQSQSQSQNMKRPYDGVISRREDCEKFKNDPCVFNTPDILSAQRADPQLPFMMFKNVSIVYGPNDIRTFSNKETYTRKGDEVFIIQPVNEFILNAINNDDDDNRNIRVFDADFINHDIVTISLETETESNVKNIGGKKYNKKKKTKTRTRTLKNIKNKTNKNKKNRRIHTHKRKY